MDTHNESVSKKSEIPSKFLCPLTKEIMKDPVLVTVSGHSYEREFIERYIREHKKDPITQQRVQLKDIVTNRALAHSIQEWNK